MNKLWLDLLSWESLVHIGLFRRSVNEVYYLHESILIKPFKKILSYLTRIKYVQITDIQLAKEKIGPLSAFEEIIKEVDKLADKYSKGWAEKNIELIRIHQLNYRKVQQHIKEATFYHLYFPVVLKVISKIMSEGNPCAFVLRKTPFYDCLRRYYEGESVCFYSLAFSQYFQIIKRDCYANDDSCNIYYSSRITNVLYVYLFWVREVVKSIFAIFCAKLGIIKLLDTDNTPTVNIGIVQSQYRLRDGEYNDLFWLDADSISSGSIYHIEYFPYDHESLQYLSRLNVKRITFNPRLSIKYRQTAGANNVPSLVMIDLKDLFSSLLPSFHSLRYLLFWGEDAWSSFQLLHLKWWTRYWCGIFTKLNIRMFWALTEISNRKLAQAQALEDLGGIYCGHHSGNYPMMTLDVQIAYDVLFTWGDHFVNNNFFNSYPILASFVTGYYRDYTFIKQRIRSEEFKSQFRDKFVLSYMDNVYANDTLSCKDSFISVYEMLLDVLKKNSSVILVCKPKRKTLFNNVVCRIPNMKKYIEQKRVIVMFGEIEKLKEVPAFVAMASNLVVGLNYSTAAAESFFSGTLAFHADLTGFPNNKFGNKGLGKVVFRDIKSLQNAIQDCIDNGVSERYEEAKEIYHMLDPFQDGQAYKRVGFVLKNLQELISQGHSREEATEIVKDRYKDYVQAAAMLN